ncbi:hypothetical protein KY290_013628 [Solanum tuberosum]|uniref:Uncharacterized protein n=1 Tax=Solanum tuberosum TaxID=4113 RepID=A0ABQ7VM83_SOLTU|nr:hypothetical protein KY289_013758 [Solanum tuberosum]KAH0769647.1 hypothetical protein KY290_013628 [Solanum tuberosum]
MLKLVTPSWHGEYSTVNKVEEPFASLMAKAAISSHAPSLYSLAVIQFNRG